MVESFTVYTYYRALRHEGVGVNHLYEAEYWRALTFAREYAKHLHFLTRVPAMSVEDGNTAIELCAYGIGYFLALL